MDDLAGGRCGRIDGSRHKRGAGSGPRHPARPEDIDAGRTDGLLTGPSKATPEQIALDYVREHFPLAGADVDNLELVARAVSPDGITHLRFNQTLDGIESYDSGIDAHVTRDGRLITVNGAPVRGASLKDKTPAVSALARPRRGPAHHGRTRAPPRVTKSSRAAASFATGEAAKLRWIAVDGKPRLAWDIYAEGGESSYTVLVDAESGDTLVRKDLTEHVGGARYFPRDPDTSPITQITMPPSWYDQNNGGTRLWGQYSRTYIDPNDQDPAPGSEEGGTRVQIPESSPGSRDWLYTRTTFPGATPCPVGGCAWDSTIAASRGTNQFQAATNVHVLVGRFSEYLAQPPIGFDEASGNFQRVNAAVPGSATTTSAPRSTTARGSTTPTSRRRPTATRHACRCTCSPAATRTAATWPTSSTTRSATASRTG